jgi:hypothetical protein
VEIDDAILSSRATTSCPGRVGYPRSDRKL